MNEGTDMSSTNGPIRLIGHWSSLSEPEREALLTRGLDQISTQSFVTK